MEFWRRSVGAGLLVAVLAGACGSRSESGAVPYQADPAGASSGASGNAGSSSGASVSSSSGSGPSSASSSGTSGEGPPAPLTAVFDPAALAADTEATYCVIRRLDNDVPVHVDRMQTTASGIVRDFAVYRVEDGQERLSPFACKLLDTLAGARFYSGGPAGMPLTVTQRADEVLQFPPGDGITLAAHQLIALQIHALAANVTGTAFATVSFTPMDDAAFLREVGMVLAGTDDFSLTGQGETKVTSTFPIPAVMAGAELLALSGRQHGRGTGITLQHGGTTLYASAVPAEPETTVFDPPVLLSQDETLRLDCTWQHDGDGWVSAGESEDSEQCFVRAHYAASQGARFCRYQRGEVPGGRCCPQGAGCP